MKNRNLAASAETFAAQTSLRLFIRHASWFGVAVLLIATNLAHAQVAVTGSGGEADRHFGEFTATGQATVYRFAVNTMTTVTAVATQSSGKPIVAGHCGGNPTEDMCVARLQIDGTQLDSSFGANGLARVLLAGQDFVRSMTVDGQDRIYLTGYCNGLGARACVHRFTANGSLDPSFGNGGRSAFSGVLEVNAIKIDGNGRAVGVGECNNGGSKMCIARLTETGAMDSQFNSGNALVVLPVNATSAVATDFVIDGSGGALLTGYCQASTANGPRYRFCLSRVTAEGVIDPAFGVGGSRSWAMVSGDDQAESSSVALTPDGGILVAGVCRTQANSIARVCTTKLTGSGNFDLTYGWGSFSGQAIQIVGDQVSPNLVRLMIDGTGRATMTVGCGALGKFCFMRLLASGQPDPTFGNGGLRSFQPETGVVGRASQSVSSVFLNGNRWLTGGYCPRPDSNFLDRGCVTRHYADTPPGERCSLDLDGNGVLETNDGLLWARWMLGFRGAPLIENAIATSATRRSATAIEAHLVNHCGLR